MHITYSYTKRINLPFHAAVTATKNALTKEQFGILSDIDIQATMKKKCDANMDRYIILGACHPQHALRALQAEREIGLFLPCNVIVYEQNTAVFAAAILPTVAMHMIENPTLNDIAQQIERKLKRAIDNIA